MQGLSTSIDALAVGVTLYGQSLSSTLVAVTIVAVITYAMCFASLRIGQAFGTRFNGEAEILGGIVLVLLGFQLLFEGLFAQHNLSLKITSHAKQPHHPSLCLWCWHFSVAWQSWR